MIIWGFKSLGESYIKKESELPENKVKLIDTRRSSSILKRVEASKGIKMLEIIKTSTLDKSERTPISTGKTITFIRAINTYPVKPHKIWIGYNTIIRPCIEYPLSTTSFTRKEVNQLIKQ